MPRCWNDNRVDESHGDDDDVYYRARSSRFITRIMMSEYSTLFRRALEHRRAIAVYRFFSRRLLREPTVLKPLFIAVEVYCPLKPLCAFAGEPPLFVRKIDLRPKYLDDYFIQSS